MSENFRLVSKLKSIHGVSENCWFVNIVWKIGTIPFFNFLPEEKRWCTSKNLNIESNQKPLTEIILFLLDLSLQLLPHSNIAEYRLLMTMEMEFVLWSFGFEVSKCAI